MDGHLPNDVNFIATNFTAIIAAWWLPLKRRLPKQGTNKQPQQPCYTDTLGFPTVFRSTLTFHTEVKGSCRYTAGAENRADTETRWDISRSCTHTSDTVLQNSNHSGLIYSEYTLYMHCCICTWSRMKCYVTNETTDKYLWTNDYLR